MSVRRAAHGRARAVLSGLLPAILAAGSGCAPGGATDPAAPPGADPPRVDGPDATLPLANDLNNSVHGGFSEPDPVLASISTIPTDPNDPMSRLGVYIEPLPDEPGGASPGLRPDLWMREALAGCQAWEHALVAIGSDDMRRFVRVDERDAAHIVIGFRPPDHRDDCDIGYSDPEATLGHAFEYAHECLAGEIHLNAGLTWVVNGSDAEGVYDVRTVVMHEVGHLLGLGHADAPSHIMHPGYPGPRRSLDATEASDVARRLANEADP